MKNVLSFFLVVMPIGFLASNLHGFTLVENGAPKATIVVAAQSNDKVKSAADDLQKYVERMSGAKLPIATDDKEAQGGLILVGKSRLTDAMKVEIPSGITPERVEEGFVIVCRGIL